MTEQEYDEQIAPLLLEIANKVDSLGGSIVCRVEWGPDQAGITTLGVTKDSGAGKQLATLAALCQGNFDQLYFSSIKHFDMSQSVVARIMRGS